MQPAAKTPPKPTGTQTFTQRVLIAVSIAAITIVLGLALWAAADAFLVIFAGILLAVFVRGVAALLVKATGWREGWALAAVVITLGLLLGAGSWLLVAEVSRQFDALGGSLRSAWSGLEQQLLQYPWGRALLRISTVQRIVSDESVLLAQLDGIFTAALGSIGNFVVILVIGVYAAISPEYYQRGLLRLFPLEHRGRVCDVWNGVGTTLRWWLLGRVASMIVVGIATTLGLWALGIPLALALGVIACLLDFVPYFGPIVAAIPAVLLALAIGPMEALYVGILFLAIQTGESYLLTPLIEQQSVELPPALTVSMQLLAGVLFGPVGVIFATPLTASLVELVKRIYVEDTLQDNLDVEQETCPNGAIRRDVTDSNPVT